MWASECGTTPTLFGAARLCYRLSVTPGCD